MRYRCDAEEVINALLPDSISVFTFDFSGAGRSEVSIYFKLFAIRSGTVEHEQDVDLWRCVWKRRGVRQPSSLLLSSLESSDTKVYEPQIRALRGTALQLRGRILSQPHATPFERCPRVPFGEMGPLLEQVLGIYRQKWTKIFER